MISTNDIVTLIAMGLLSANASAAASQLSRAPLELPRGEAADVDVELVESRVVPVADELDLDMEGRDARGRDARCVNPETRWKALLGYRRSS